MAPKRPSHGPHTRKAVLFCASCGHESPVDGDWTVAERETGTTRCVLKCPDCEHVVVDRPRFDPVPV